MAWEGYSCCRSSPGVVGEGTAVGERERAMVGDIARPKAAAKWSCMWLRGCRLVVWWPTVSGDAGGC